MNQLVQLDAGQWGMLKIDFSDDPKPYPMLSDHSHKEWELFCWLGSRMTYYLGGKTMRVPHCAVVPVPPGVPHRTKYGTEELRWKLDISFENRFLDIFPTEEARNRIRAVLGRGMLPVPVKWANELRALVVGTLLPAGDGGASAVNKAVFAVAMILASLEQATSEAPAKQEKAGIRHTHAAAALELIDRDYATVLSPRILADRLHLTETYLCHLFRDVLDMTVSEAVRHRRIQAAQVMLQETRASVAEIAEQVGFDNVNYFTKCFRKETGTSPSRYRTVVQGEK